MKINRIIIPLLLTILISSCGGPSKTIFKKIPETAFAVITFHPGNLHEKGRLQELDFMREALSKNDFSEKLLEEPESSGLNMNAYSTFFVFEKDPRYGCLIMPVENKEKFEDFLAEIEHRAQEIVERGKLGEYDMINADNSILVFDNKISLLLFPFDNQDAELKPVAEKLLTLDKENNILTDKDFNYFLGKQKDINAWFTSTNLNTISGSMDLDETMDFLGGIKNNYGHAFLDFQDGSMKLITNLRFNRSIEETIKKYDFLDEKAAKDLLKYLPSEEIIFVGNTNVKPEKIIALLDLFYNEYDDILNEMEEELNIDKDQLKSSFSGELAFSANGAGNYNILINKDTIKEATIPKFIIASRMKNTRFFDVLVAAASKHAKITKIKDYYQFANSEIQVYILQKDMDMILTNSIELIEEINTKGKIVQNVTKSDFNNILTRDPVCFFLNLDKDSYSADIREMINKEMGDDLAERYEKFGDKLKSMSFTANLKEWQFEILLKSTGENSLYSVLSQIDQ